MAFDFKSLLGNSGGLMDQFKLGQQADAKDDILNSLLSKGLSSGLYNPNVDAQSQKQMSNSFGELGQSLASVPQVQQPLIETSNNTANQLSDKLLMRQTAPPSTGPLQLPSTPYNGQYPDLVTGLAQKVAKGKTVVKPDKGWGKIIMVGQRGDNEES